MGNEVGASLKQGRPGWDDGIGVGVTQIGGAKCPCSPSAERCGTTKLLSSHMASWGFTRGLDRPKFEASLDELGREGYELTWVFMDQKLHSEKDGHVLIFKRVARPPIEHRGTEPLGIGTGGNPDTPA